MSLPSRPQKGIGSRHLIASLLLLAVFFLLLHLHFFTSTAQVNKECSCYHGGRTQAGLAPAPANWTPTFQVSSVIVYGLQVFGWCSFDSCAIRAPPSIASL